nr:hypothetical protein [Cytophagales bacterium]
MPNLEKHIIHKVTVDVVTPSVESGEHLRQNLSGFLEEQVFPLLEAFFAGFDEQVVDGSLQVDSISLDLNVERTSIMEWDQVTILTQCRNQLETAFRPLFSTAGLVDVGRGSTFTARNTNTSVVPAGNEAEGQINPSFRRFPDAEKSLLAFISFLSDGRIPWWGYSAPDLKKLDDQILDSWSVLREFNIQLRETLRTQPARHRLLLHFTPEQLIKLLAYLSEKREPEKKILSRSLKYFRKATFAEARLMTWVLLEMMFDTSESRHLSNQQEALILLLGQNAGRKPSVAKINGFVKVIGAYFPEKERETLNQLAERISHTLKSPISTEDFPVMVASDSALREVSDANFSSTQDVVLSFQEGILLPNAGSILLHPFLGAFFRDCGVMTEDNRFYAPDLAVHLLHYATTGILEAPDYTLQFEKLLLGIPLNRTLDRYVLITQKHKEQVRELLNSLLENWPKLKNTSADTVRVEFLQRSGKVLWEGNSLRIIMEKKVQDILLDGLPFNLGMVKLPWRRNLIFVEW